LLKAIGNEKAASERGVGTLGYGHDLLLWVAAPH
jgi:hypothetical protein